MQYVVETRYVGERELGTSHTEVVDVKERIVEVAQPGPTCPANTGQYTLDPVEIVSSASTMLRTLQHANTICSAGLPAK